MARANPNWKAIGIYYLISCAVSWPFYYMRAVSPEAFKALPVHLFFLPSFYMWGPAIGALLVFLLFRRQHKRTVTLFGNSIGYSLLFLLLPLSIWAIATAFTQELPALFPNGATVGGWLLLLLAFVINTLGEELGWRGYLQDALRPLPFTQRFLTLGFMWEFWHLVSRYYSNVDGTLGGRIMLSLILLLVILGATFIIGIAVERSHSIIIAVTLHIWLNLNFEMPFATTWVICFLSIPFWIWLIKRWPSSIADETVVSVGDQTPLN